MKKMTPKTKKLIIKSALILAILLLISGLCVLLLYLFGVISFTPDFHFNEELFDSFKNTWYGCILFVLFQTILTVLLCPIPGTSMAFIILSTTIYDKLWQAFLLSFISVLISSFGMYLVGRFGGYKICEKLLGKEDCEKSLSLLRDKGTVYFPLMMLFPAFPDDALVMIAGTSKMKLKWFIPSILIGRGVGIFTIVFGLKVVPFDQFRPLDNGGLYDWAVFITICVFWILLFFKLAHKLNLKIEKMHQKADEEKAQQSLEIVANEEENKPLLVTGEKLDEKETPSEAPIEKIEKVEEVKETKPKVRKTKKASESKKE